MLKNNTAFHQRLTEVAQKTADDIVKESKSGPYGLNTLQVKEAREQYGDNHLTGHPSDTILYRLKRAFINPFTMILTVLTIISWVTDVLMAGSSARNGTTIIIMLCMLLISGLVRLRQELHAKRVAERLTHLVASTVKVCRDGAWVELPAEELVVGDCVTLTAGDRVPADIRLTEAHNLFVSQSVITGESAITEKTNEPLQHKPRTIGEMRNILFAGSAITGGNGEGIVLTVGNETVYGSIACGEHFGKKGFDRGANSIAWVLIRFMAILTPVVLITSGLTQGDWLAALLFALSVAVGLTPEMLPMVINACLAKGSATMGKKQTIVRNINAMQSFGSMDVLCVDKTGTLTGDTVTLEYYMDILGNESKTVLEYAWLNSHYHTGMQNHLDQAILKYSDMPGLDTAILEYTHPLLDNQPFDYERRFAGVLVGGEKQNLLLVKGAVDDVCTRCSHAEYHGQLQAMDAEGIHAVHAVVDEMTEDGMKVLAVAYKPLAVDRLLSEDENDLILLGYLAFFDAPKKSAAGAIHGLQERHVSIRVLTGDNLQVAQSICRRLGVETKHTLTGRQLDALTEDERHVRIEQTTIFAELSPKQKASVVETLAVNGHTVGFLGDGMNDLPAMAEADVGISVDTAAEAVKEAADVILLKKDLNVLEEGIMEGRRAFSNMTKYIKITASSNFGNILSIVVAGVFLPFFPMTSVQLLLLNLLYDMLCLALPWDRVDEEELHQPCEWSGSTLGHFMRFFGPISSVFDVITFLFLFFGLCPTMCGGAFATLDAVGQARFIALFQTGWFLESMWTQVLILHLLRTRKLPMVQSRPARPVIAVTLVGTLLFTLLTFTGLGSLIGLTALPPAYFLFLLGTVGTYLLLVTLAKAFYVRRFHTLI